jgi:hypothetical protein
VKRPGSPFAARGADVQVLGLDDAVLDVRHQSLLGMGYELLAMSYIGPRHAIRAADLRTMQQPLLRMGVSRVGTVVGKFRSCGGHVRCMDHQRGRVLVNRETVNVESDRPYCCCDPWRAHLHAALETTTMHALYRCVRKLLILQGWRIVFLCSSAATSARKIILQAPG